MFLKELTELPGVSGFEYEVRKYIKEKLNSIGCEYYTDNVGNIIAHNKGSKNKTIMIDAHMDEVGLIVTHVDSEGFIKFDQVGAVDARVLNSKVVEIGKKRIKGVIGSKAVHLMNADEKGRAVPINELYIDIGTCSKEETDKLVSVGDFVVFESEYVEFGNNMIKARALDDRLGCAIILDLLAMKLDVDFYGVFSIMEEVDYSGAITAAYALQPDFAIVLEGTVSADMPNVEEHLKTTTVGKGAALTYMDMDTIYDVGIVRRIAKMAEDLNIPHQYKKTTRGGTNAGGIHKVKDGAKSVAISVPCRYIHSSVNAASKEDYSSVLALVKAVLFNQNYIIQKEGMLL